MNPNILLNRDRRKTPHQPHAPRLRSRVLRNRMVRVQRRARRRNHNVPSVAGAVDIVRGELDAPVHGEEVDVEGRHVGLYGRVNGVEGVEDVVFVVYAGVEGDEVEA